MIIILTIERRMHLAEATKQSLLDNGVLEEDIVIMYGYDKDNYPEMKKPYHLLTKAFLERVLPFAIENNSSILYTECGTLFKSNPLELLIIKDKITEGIESLLFSAELIASASILIFILVFKNKK